MRVLFGERFRDMAPTLRSRARIGWLPAEMLQKVFEYLDDRSKCRVSCVCRAWRDIVYAHRKNDVVFIRTINSVIRNYKFFVKNEVHKFKFVDDGVDGTSHIGIMYFAMYVKILHLDLSDSMALDDTKFKKIGYLTKLKWLSLDRCTEISSSSFEIMYRWLINLEYLSVRYTNITRSVLCDMANRLKKLQYLDIGYCPDLDEVDLRYIAEFFVTLKTLIVDGLGGVTDVVLFLAFTHIPHLKKLSAQNCKSVYGHVTTHCPETLEILDIRKCGGRYEPNTTIFNGINRRRDGSLLVRFTTPSDSDVNIRV